MAECLISGAGIVLGYAFGIGTWVIFFALKKSFVNEAINQLKKDNMFNGEHDKPKPKPKKKITQDVIFKELKKSAIGDEQDENLGESNS